MPTPLETSHAETRTTFIYALCEPGTRTVRYVGKSDNPKRRLKDHLSAARKGQETYACRWMRQLLAAGKPQLFVLGEVPLSGWESVEKNVIAAARALGMNITNTTEGGDGVVNPSPEARARQRQKMLGRSPPNKGKPMSAEQKKLVGDFHRGKPKPKTAEWLKNNGLARRGLKRSAQACANSSASHFGRKTSRNTSGFVGISWRAKPRKWEAHFSSRGVYHYAGRFSKIEDAVFARSLSVANL